MDYKLKLMQILDCFEDIEGTWYSNWWKDYGLTDEEKKHINREFNAYIKNKDNK